MSILSALRSVHYLARDIWSALHRLVAPPDDDNPDAYAEHLATLRADALAEREAQTEVTEPCGDCGLGEADECLCQPDGRLVCDACRDQLTSAAPGAILPPDAAPESPAPPVPRAGAGHPDLTADDWYHVFVAIDHMGRVTSNSVPWNALAERISHALADGK
jgi:hypothetical protein